MNLDANSLLASILISGIGFVFFVYGTKQGRIPQMAGGAILSIYPYFISDAVWMLVIGAVVIALTTVAIKLGL